MMQKEKAWIKLLSAPQIGKAKAIKLAKVLGEPKKYIGSSSSLLDDIDFISESAKEYLSNDSITSDWNKIAELIDIRSDLFQFLIRIIRNY